MIYLDTSAAAKMILAEEETPALTAFLAPLDPRALVSSALLYPELMRTVTRRQPRDEPRVIAFVERMMLVPLVTGIVVSAAKIGSPVLRTLDALHLASALAVFASVTAFVTYDKQLAAAATAVGFSVTAPA